MFFLFDQVCSLHSLAQPITWSVEIRAKLCSVKLDFHGLPFLVVDPLLQ